MRRYKLIVRPKDMALSGNWQAMALAEMHEDPPVFNYGKHGEGLMLKSGMCIAIEPMVTLGDPKVWMLHDHWQIITRDMSLLRILSIRLPFVTARQISYHRLTK